MWDVKFNQDTDAKGIGTVSAINGSFNYTRRVDTNDEKDVESFVAEAKEKNSTIETAKVEVSSVVSLISNLLNK